MKIASVSISNPSTSAQVTLNGLTLSGLLDTGSPTTMMSLVYAESCKVTKTPYYGNKRWKSASGDLLRVNGQAKVELYLSGLKIEAIVVIVDQLVHDLIIGTDVMTSYGFNINYESRTLTVGEHVLKIKAKGYEEAEQACVSISVRVPARSERVVWLKTNVVGSFMVESNRSCGVSVAEGLQETIENGIFPVTLKNHSDEPIHITRGTAVCDVTRAKIEGYLVKKIEEDGIEPLKVMSTEVDEVWKPSETAKIDEANMSADTVELYKALLDENEDVFSRTDEDIGQTYVEHDIKLIDYKPFKSRPYRVPVAQVEIVEKHVKEMLDMGVIQPSAGPYASPIVLVKKSDNSIRFCVDYSKLNSVTVKDNYPLPLIEERIDQIFGSSVFSGLDLTSGYWQFALTASSRELTAFICHLGLFEFLRMPFGLCNAGATFQRSMEHILVGLAFAMAYVDDVLIHSRSHEEHLNHLQVVFERIRKAKLKVKLRKCEFGYKQTKFLGYVVSGEGIRMNEEKINKILEYPSPTNAKRARRFNGLSSYFSDFIPDYAHLNAPLQIAALLTTKDPVTKKRVPKKFLWTKDCQSAFDKLKQIIAERPVLIHPNVRKRFRIITDASGVGLGAVLAQLDEQGTEKVVCFAGRALNEAERRYTTGERELLAVKWAVRKFKCYVYGVSFDVFTDHKPLVHVRTSRNPSNRMIKWILELEEFNATYHFRPGKFNIPADALSRVYEEEETLSWYERSKPLDKLLSEQNENLRNTSQMSFQSDSDTEDSVLAVADLVPDSISKSMITEAQYQDRTIGGILSKLIEWNDSQSGESFKCDKEDTIYLVDSLSGNHRIVLPLIYRKHTLRACHDDLGGSHLGRVKTLHKVAQRFFWIGMAKDVKEYVASCEHCNQRKSSRKPTSPTLISLPSVMNPFDRVAVDFVGPLPKTKRGNAYILVFVDYATRWPEAFATANRQASTVAEIFIKEILCRHGAPIQLLSDQGKEFLSAVVKETTIFTRTHKIQTAAYHPQTNGLCERFNGTLTNMLAAYSSENQDDWDTMLPIALFGYRTAVQDSSKCVPAELLYARQLRLPMNIDLFAPKLEFSKRIRSEFKRAQENIARVAEASRKRLLSKNKPIMYTKGDYIRVKEETTPQGLSRKLQSDLWSDPVEIKEVQGNNVLAWNKGAEKWINQDRIKKAETLTTF